MWTSPPCPSSDQPHVRGSELQLRHKKTSNSRGFRVCVKTQALRQGTPSGVPQVGPFQYLFSGFSRCGPIKSGFSHRLFSRAETKAHNQGVLTLEETNLPQWLKPPL